MEELDLLLSDFVDVEYGIESLLVVLRALEEMYDMEREEALKANLTVIIRQLDSLREDLREDITNLDLWMLKAKKEN